MLPWALARPSMERQDDYTAYGWQRKGVGAHQQGGGRGVYYSTCHCGLANSSYPLGRSLASHTYDTQSARPQVFLGASATPAVKEEAAAAAASPATVSFVSAEELATLSPDQVAFLERKRRAATGLGPVMPEGSACERCYGVGTCTCSQCGGAGVNSTDITESKFNVRRGFCRCPMPSVSCCLNHGSPASPAPRRPCCEQSPPLRPPLPPQNDRNLIHQTNGVTSIAWFCTEGAPCWLCRGRCHMGCPDCGGSGIRGGVERYTGD